MIFSDIFSVALLTQVFYCYRIYILMKSKFAVAVIVVVRLRVLATKLSYSCVFIILALNFTDRCSDCSGSTNNGSKTSYQYTADRDISDYNWRTRSLDLPIQRHSEYNLKNRSGQQAVLLVIQ